MRPLLRLGQAYIFAGFYFGLQTINLGIIANSVFALTVLAVPGQLHRSISVRVHPLVTLLLVVTLSLHVHGIIFGLYVPGSGWDHVTHTLGGLLLGVTGYTVWCGLLGTLPKTRVTQGFLFVFILTFAMGMGVLWEVIEFLTVRVTSDVGIVVIGQAGIDDAILDLVADMVGGLVVALLAVAR